VAHTVDHLQRAAASAAAPTFGRSPPDDAPCCIFAIDGTLAHSQLADLAAALTEYMEGLPPLTPMGLVVFTGVVSVYELGPTASGAVRAASFPGGERLSRDSRRALRRHQRDPPPGGK
jgi:hypothetical protein